MPASTTKRMCGRNRKTKKRGSRDNQFSGRLFFRLVMFSANPINSDLSFVAHSRQASANFVQVAPIFAVTTPNVVVRVVLFLRRLVSVIHDVIQRDFQSTRHLLQSLDGRNRVAVLHAGDG